MGHLKDQSGSYTSGLLLVSVALLLGGVLASFLKSKPGAAMAVTAVKEPKVES
jgi:hypothetical protein